MIKKVLLILLLFVFPIIVSASDLDIMPINYVNGDSTLLKSSEDYLLIDAGYGDNGADQTVLDFLEKNFNGKKNFKLNLYLSHYDGDHLGGAAKTKVDGTRVWLLKYLMYKYKEKIGVIYLPYVPETYKNGENATETSKTMYNRFTSLNDFAKKYGLTVVKLTEGSKFKFGNTSAEVLFHNTDIKSDNLSNNSSLVTMFINGKTKFLTAGDIEKTTEYKILKSNLNIKADIFKLSHHSGYWSSNYSNNSDFVKKVQPKYFYMQIRNSLDGITYDRIKGALPDLLTFSNMYSNIDINMYSKGKVMSNGEIKFSVLNDEITPTMQNNSYRMTLKYIDEETGKVLKNKFYDFSSSEKYYLYDYKKSFTGYTLSGKGYNFSQSGILKNNIVYEILYKKNRYTLTIKHVDLNGKVLIDNEVLTYEYNSSYSTQSKIDLLTKYDLIEEPKNKNGVITKNEVVTYRYKEKDKNVIIVSEDKEYYFAILFLLPFLIYGIYFIFFGKKS